VATLPSPGAGAPSTLLRFLSAYGELSIKILSLASVFLSGVGLLVTNTSLAKYGTRNFSIVTPQCLFTGIWAAALLLLASVPGFSFIWTVTDDSISKKKRLALALGFFIALAYLSTL
jgi:hypothetical protein